MPHARRKPRKVDDANGNDAAATDLNRYSNLSLRLAAIPESVRILTNRNTLKFNSLKASRREEQERGI